MIGKTQNEKRNKEVYFSELNTMLIRKTQIQSQINRLGNQLWRLKNERLKFQTLFAAMEKKIREKIIKNNNVSFIEDDKPEKKDTQENDRQD